MKKAMTFLLIAMLFLTACAVQYKVVKETAQPGQESARPNVSVELKPEFKIIAQHAVRNPPTIKGTVRNNGLGSGDVKLIGRVYYAGVIASENTAVIENLKSEEERNFSISIDPVTQWTSYSVHIE